MDDAAIKRAKDALEAKGVAVTLTDLRDAFNAAVTPPEPEIPVSKGMINAGRQAWQVNGGASPRVVLPIIYRAMEQMRRDEKKD